MTVVVSAPYSVSGAYADKLVIKYHEDIFDALEYYGKRRKPPELKYESGEVVRLFGRDRRLAVIHGEKDSAELFGDVIILTVTENVTEKKQKLLDGFLRKELLTKAESICRELFPYFKRRGVSFPKIAVRRMKASWGNCSTLGKITFSTELVDKPLECIEFIAAHELTHLLYPDHSKDFYAELDMVMPDWKARNKKLNDHMQR